MSDPGSGFAVDNGTVYLPIRYDYTTDGWETAEETKYYMYVSGDFTEIDYMTGYPDYNKINGITVLNGTVYIAGQVDNKPFYGVAGNSAYTSLSENNGQVNCIVVQDGSLWFYGAANNSSRAWDAEGNSTLIYDGNTDAVTYSYGKVYMRWGSSGYIIRAGGDNTNVNLYGPNEETQVQVSGIAVK